MNLVSPETSEGQLNPESKLVERCFLLEEEEGRRHIQHTDVSMVFRIRISVLVTQSLVSHI